MFVSLRYPDGKEYPEIPLSHGGILDGIEAIAELPQARRDALVQLLTHACPDPAVLTYRAELAEELVKSPKLAEIFRDLSELRSIQKQVCPSGETVEIHHLLTVTAFQDFSRQFDRFCDSLSSYVPESAAAKRCFLCCRNYGESFEYKELKVKAAEVIRALGFSYGFTLAVGNPTDGEPTVRLRKESDEAEGVRRFADRVLAEFGVSRSEEKPPCQRPYTDIEIAVLTGIIRKDPRLARRLEDFTESFAAAGTEEILRLGNEALAFVAANEIYTRGQSAGYSLCRPVFRNTGFYSEITELCYTSQSGDVQRQDFSTSPLNHLTVVCGPDAEAYLNAVGFAHLAASAGGLVFAREAQIAPVTLLERDQKERLSTEHLTEDSLCLCGHMFDAMLPRQEDAAVTEVLLRLAEQNTRSVVRICSKSNLSVLEKKVYGNLLPSCTLLQVGTDRTLEELLQRHRLTEEKEADV
ncbi:MAG: hypothetical protein J6B54_02990 [Clostridia bacterium]|nr:hypothetical protein [Clostridia bacterium]